MTEDDRIDFSALETLSLDALVRRIETRCAPLLAEARERPMTSQIVSWWRPAVAAALIVAAASAVLLLRTPSPQPPASNASMPDLMARTQLASLLGVPRPLVNSLSAPVLPTLADLIQEGAQ